MNDINKKSQLTSKFHSNASGTLVVIWLLGGILLIYLSKSGQVSKDVLVTILVGYIFAWMCIDLFLGLYFKEYPQFIADIKYKENPKTYIVRTIFNSLIIIAAGYFLLK